jgi:hypothetical protein
MARYREDFDPRLRRAKDDLSLLLNSGWTLGGIAEATKIRTGLLRRVLRGFLKERTGRALIPGILQRFVEEHLQSRLPLEGPR